jgi:hypothetical protein
MVDPVAAATERFAPMVKGSPAGPRRSRQDGVSLTLGAGSGQFRCDAPGRSFRPLARPLCGIGSSSVAGALRRPFELVAGGVAR